MPLLFVNNATAELSVATAPVARADGTRTSVLTLKANGERFPEVDSGSGDYFYVTVVTSSQREICKCILHAENSNTLTVERQIEDTPSVPRSGNEINLPTTAGSETILVETRLTAGSLKEIYDRAETVIPVGTKMVFMQRETPTGWTKVANVGDSVLRITDGENWKGSRVKTGKSFEDIFGTDKSLIAGTAITRAQLPAFNMTVQATAGYAANIFNAHRDNAFVVASLNAGRGWGLSGQIGDGKLPVNAIWPRNLYVSTGGSGSAHTHNINLDVNYFEGIICEKAEWT